MTTRRQMEPDGWGPRRGPLADYAATLRRWRSTIVVTTLVVAVLAAGYSYTRTPVYTSFAEVLVRPVLSSPLDAARPSDISAETESNIAGSLAVASIASKALGVPADARTLLTHLVTSMPEGSQVLTVSFSGASAEETRAGADAFAEAYLAYRRERATRIVDQRRGALILQIEDLNQRIETVRQRMSGTAPGGSTPQQLQTRLDLLNATHLAVQNQLATLSTLVTDPGEIIDPANTPRAPSSPKHPFDIALGLFFGLFLGAGLAFVRDQTRRRLDSADAVEDTLGIPALAAVPRMGWLVRRSSGGLVVASRPTDPAAHAYRTLRTGLVAARGHSGARIILVTSASPGEGKTTTAANLGAALAELGQQVTLISADLRKPALHRLVGVPAKPGLAEFLANGTKLPKVVRKTTIKDLRVVPSGRLSTATDPANLLESPRLSKLLAEFAEVDWVIVDAPPVLGPADTLVLVEHADAVLLVIDARKTTESAAAVACRQIERAGGRILGAVLNQAEGFSSYSDYQHRGWLGSLSSRTSAMLSSRTSGNGVANGVRRTASAQTKRKAPARKGNEG